LFGTESNGQIAPGVLERAGAGTLFVNELEDLPAQAQRALLRTLESGQRIARTDAKGERSFLDEAQVAQEAAKARQAVQQWCG
jgi:transcriptional regulator with AAA-type ATPase domain